MWWVIFWLLSSLFRIFWKGRIYVIQDVAGKLACNQQLMMPGWPNKNENIEKFFFSSGGGGVPPPPSSGFFSIFPDRVEDWKTLTLQGIDKYKTLCSEKKKPSRTALLQHIKLCALFSYWTCKNHLLFGTFSPENRKCPFNFQGRPELNKVYDNAVLTFSPPKLKARFIPCDWRSCDLVCVLSSACVRTVAYLYWQGYISKLLKPLKGINFDSRKYTHHMCTVMNRKVKVSKLKDDWFWRRARGTTSWQKV